MSKKPQTSNRPAKTAIDAPGSAECIALDEFRPRLLRMVGVRMDARLRSRLDASDIVQDTLIEATRRLPEWQQNPAIPLYPWLRQIAWEQLVQMHRKHVLRQKRSVTRETSVKMRLPDDSVAGLSAIAGKQPSPSEQAIHGETQRQVHEALDQLPQGDRELLLMRYLEQMPLVEIAACLGLSPSAIRMRHLRALERLRKLMEPPGSGDLPEDGT